MKKTNSSWLELLLLSVIFILLATYKIGSDFPPGLNHDAAWTGLYAMRILNGEPFRVYTPEAFGQETLFHYLMSFVFLIKGVSKESIELTATLVGLTSIPIFYFLIHKLSKNGLISFVSTFLWILSTALIIYSRVGWRLITLIPLVLTLLYFMQSYLDKKSRASALMIGLFSGATLYTYHGGRSVVFLFFIFWAAIGLIYRNKKYIVDLIYSLISFILISFPIILFALNNWEVYNGRATFLLSSSFSQIVKNAVTALLFFNLNANGNDFFTNFPVLEGIVSILWIAGFFIAILRLRKYWIYVLAFIVFLIPSVLTVPSFHRAVGTLPIVYIFAAIAIVEAGKLLATLNKNLFKELLIAFVVIQFFVSFKKLYVDKQPFLWGFYPEATEVGRVLKEVTGESVVYAENWPIDTLTFMSLKNHSSTEPSSKNYQSYTTSESDPINNLLKDLNSGRIKKDSSFTVDIGKKAFFEQSLEQRGYQIRVISKVFLKGNPIAYIYTINR